jgi:iron complex outermembrane recepter protein
VQGDGEADGLAIDTGLQGKFSTGGIEHTLLGGIDFFHTGWEHYRDLVTLTGVPRGEVEPLLDMFNPVRRGSANYEANLRPQIYTETESDQVGLYLQDQMKIGNLRLTVGGRQDWANDVIVNPLTGVRYTTKSSDFTWQAGAVYLFDNGLAPYVSYSESFQPMVSDPASNLDGQPFEPTTGQQYEAGLRFQPANGRSYFTLGGYQITQQNVATPAPSPAPGIAPGIPASTCGTSVCNVQTGEIRVRGIEFEARAATDIGFTLVGSVTRAWTKVTESNIPAELGNKVTQMPDWMASAFVDYRLSEGVLRAFGLGGGIRYTGKTWGDIANTLRIPDHTLFDLFLRYDFGLSNPALDGLSVSVNARNLTDETYVATCGSTAACYYGSGRTVTARVQYRW